MTTNDRRGHGHRARLVVVVLGLLLGLLGMHALSLHGANATPDANQVTSQAVNYGAPTASHAAHSSGDTAAQTSATADKAVQTSATDDAGRDGGMSGHGGHNSGAMLMMCLAVLAVALSLLWPALARGFGHLCRARPAPARATPLRSLRLSTGPPLVWQFSVLRC